MTAHDPEAAVQFSLQIQSPDAAKQAIQATFKGWMCQDSIAASERASQLPKGTIRDFAAESIVRESVRSGDLDSAVSWAESISSDEIREPLLQEIRRSLK